MLLESRSGYEAAQPAVLAGDACETLLVHHMLPFMVSQARSCASALDRSAALSATLACLQRLHCEMQRLAGNSLPFEEAPQAEQAEQARLPEGWALHIAHVLLQSVDDRLRITPGIALQALDVLCSVLRQQQSPQHAGQDLSNPGSKPDVLQQLVSLMATSSAGKTRLSLLATLVPHAGAVRLLRAQPDLIAECIAQMRGNSAHAGGNLFSALLRSLHTELQQKAGAVDEDPAAGSDEYHKSSDWLHAWRRHWLKHVVEMLHWEDSTCRGRAAVYTLPAIFQIDPGSFSALLQAVAPTAPIAAASRQQWGLTAPQSHGSAIAALVQILLLAKKQELFGSLEDIMYDNACLAAENGAGTGDAESQPGCQMAIVPKALILAASESRDEDVRLALLELAALDKKTTLVRCTIAAPCLCSCTSCRHLLYVWRFLRSLFPTS